MRRNLFPRLMAASLAFAFMAAADTALAIGDGDYQIPAGKDHIKIVSYNAENLFDTEHDDGKDDYTFLPKGFPGKTAACQKLTVPAYRKACLETDWTPDKLKVKLLQLRRAVAAQGELPDVLALSEIENEKVTALLARALGYSRFVISNGPDERGIDLAILFKEDKLRYVDHREINVSTGKLKTRPILQAVFRVRTGDGDEFLSVFANHWPSQASPTAHRGHVAGILRDAIDNDIRRIKSGKYHAIAVGDFNTLPSESPNPVDDVLLDKRWPHALVDVHVLSDESNNPMKNEMPPASYYYTTERKWNRLDKVLATAGLHDGRGLELEPETFRVVAPSFMTKPSNERWRVPVRCDHNATSPDKAGFSDHLPVAVRLRLR